METFPRIKYFKSSEIIENNMKIYGKSVIKDLFPNYIDGLKSVIRRCIWANYDGKIKSGISFLSESSKYHVHAPESTYLSITRLSQTFSCLHPLFEIQGKSGNYSLPTSAHFRYVEIKLSNFCYEVFISRVETKTLKMINGENLDNLEPENFIPIIPISLLLSSATIGFGYSSLISSYNLTDINNFVKLYLETKKGSLTIDEFENIVNKTFSTFPIGNNIISNNPIIIEGTLEIITPTTIHLKTLPFSINLQTIYNNVLIKLLNEGVISDLQNISNKKEEACISISFKNNNTFYDTFFFVLKKLQFIHKFTIINNFQKAGLPIELNIYNRIDCWYLARKTSLASQLRNSLIKIKQELRRIECYKILLKGDNVNKAITIIKANKLEAARLLLSKVFKLTLFQANIIVRSRLSTLSKTSAKELINNENKLIKDRIIVLTQLKNLDEYILNEVTEITRKYNRNTHVSKKPNYLGYIVIDNNLLIRFVSNKELNRLLEIYKNKFVHVYLAKDKLLLNLSFKYTGNSYNQKYERGIRYTNIKSEDARIFQNRNIKYLSSIDINKNYELLNRNKPGIIVYKKKTVLVDDLKNINGEILYAKNIVNTDNHVVIISIDKNHTNTIKMQYMKINRLRKFISGTSATILDIITFNTFPHTAFINIKDKSLSKSYFKITFTEKIQNDKHQSIVIKQSIII